MVEKERAFPPPNLALETVGELELLDAEETRELGGAFAETMTGAGFLGLVGPLGAGKTTLVQGFMNVRGAGDAVARSPTYTLLNVYRTDPPVVHVDLYRLTGVDDLESTGYWDYVTADRRDIIVEWFDRVPQAWPGEGLIVELSHQQSGRCARMWASAEQQRLAKEILDRFERSRETAKH